jgi:hypothetical protein
MVEHVPPPATAVAAQEDPSMKCSGCRQEEDQTPVVYGLMIWSPILPRGVCHLTCHEGENYRLCNNDGCNSVLIFIEKALDSSPLTRHLKDLWTHAQINWESSDLKPWQVEHRRPEMARA